MFATKDTKGTKERKKKDTKHGSAFVISLSFVVNFVFFVSFVVRKELKMTIDPHSTQPILTSGAALNQATMAMVLLHGRGASAEDILGLGSEFARDDLAFLAPQAAGNAWYPQRFIAPLAANEPYLSSALAKVGRVLAQIAAAGIPLERTFLLGFSQGACLALEYAARNPQRYGGVIGLSGGLIGPEGMTFAYPGSLAGTPVFLGCSDVDFHIPVDRVRESSAALRQLGGDVTERIYPGMGHTVNDDELAFVRELLATVTKQ